MRGNGFFDSSTRFYSPPLLLPAMTVPNTWRVKLDYTPSFEAAIDVGVGVETYLRPYTTSENDSGEVNYRYTHTAL